MTCDYYNYQQKTRKNGLKFLLTTITDNCQFQIAILIIAVALSVLLIGVTATCYYAKYKKYSKVILYMLKQNCTLRILRCLFFLDTNIKCSFISKTASDIGKDHSFKLMMCLRRFSKQQC